MNEEFKDIEENTSDDSNIFQSDLENINVNVWFNKVESRLQYCLVKDDAKDGFMQYKMLVRHAELLAIASKKVDVDTYLKEVAELTAKEVNKSDEDEVKEMKESMIKYKVILKNLLTLKKTTLNLSY